MGHLQDALHRYQQADNIHGQGLVHNYIGAACYDLGRWRDADHHYRCARDIFYQIGDVYYRALSENNIGTIARFQGRLGEARAYFEKALRSLEQLGGSPYQVAIFHMNLGDVSIAHRESAEARRHLDVSRRHAEQAQARALLPDLHRLTSEAALLAGELDLAVEEGRLSRDIARELEMRGDEGHALRALGEVATTYGDMARAERDLRESIAILQEVGQKYGTALSQLALARVLVSQGRLEEARHALDQCVPVFERLEAALDLERARALLEAMAVAL
jgi:tetratricopeptide (TPR) repeat protein